MMLLLMDADVHEKLRNMTLGTFLLMKIVFQLLLLLHRATRPIKNKISPPLPISPPFPFFHRCKGATRIFFE